MRRTHWVGVGAGVVALVGAALVGPTALVASATPHKPAVSKSASHKADKPAPHKVKGGKSTAKNKHHGDDDDGKHGHKHHGKPPYPPGRDCSLSIDMPTTGYKGQVVTVTVKVSYNKQALGGVTVGLYNAKDQKSWRLIDTKKAASDGTVTFSYNVNHDAYVKVMVAGGDHVKATQSASVKITLKK